MARLPKPQVKPVVLLLEPHPIAARHLATALRQGSALEVITSDVNLAGVPVLSGKPSIVVIDGDALPFPFVAFLRTLRMAFGDVRVLAIGKRLADDELSLLLFRGVSGFVDYAKVEQEICAAVDALLRGRTWFSSRVLERYAMLSSRIERVARGGAWQPVATRN